MTEVISFIDIHSHIVFGADDGAQSLWEAMQLLKLDRDEGAFAVFATPHYGRENNNYVPDAAMVMRNFELLKERAAEEVPEVPSDVKMSPVFSLTSCMAPPSSCMVKLSVRFP